MTVMSWVIGLRQVYFERRLGVAGSDGQLVLHHCFWWQCCDGGVGSGPVLVLFWCFLVFFVCARGLIRASGLGKCISAKASVFFCCVHLPPCIVQSSFC